MLVPDGEERARLVCPECGYIAYYNPRVIVGSVVTLGDRFLLCRRAIAPRRGFWTLPAGYLECGETTQEGAAREAWEEARARIAIDLLLALYDLVAIGQVQFIYRAHLLDPDIAPGPESLEVALMRWADIPWSEIAFPSVGWALDDYRARVGHSGCAPLGNQGRAE